MSTKETTVSMNGTIKRVAYSHEAVRHSSTAQWDVMETHEVSLFNVLFVTESGKQFIMHIDGKSQPEIRISRPGDEVTIDFNEEFNPDERVQDWDCVNRLEITKYV